MAEESDSTAVAAAVVLRAAVAVEALEAADEVDLEAADVVDMETVDVVDSEVEEVHHEELEVDVEAAVAQVACAEGELLSSSHIALKVLFDLFGYHFPKNFNRN